MLPVGKGAERAMGLGWPGAREMRLGRPACPLAYSEGTAGAHRAGAGPRDVPQSPGG